MILCLKNILIILIIINIIVIIYLIIIIIIIGLLLLLLDYYYYYGINIIININQIFLCYWPWGLLNRESDKAQSKARFSWVTWVTQLHFQLGQVEPVFPISGQAHDPNPVHLLPHFENPKSTRNEEPKRIKSIKIKFNQFFPLLNPDTF